ncbi:MAG TPA: hypothetical protein VFL85_04165, partial [Candidatus Saccharimonadales bacterium]|nr:hypothetical protein [Candidatus Saccharimonadales bacterium]
MKRSLSLLSLAVGTLVYAASLAAPAALAATSTIKSTPSAPGSGQALEISPPAITMSGNPGQTLRAQISLRDVSQGNLLVSNQINDFVAAGEDGTPKILMGKDANDSPFSMRKWVVPLPKMLLEPRQIKTLPVIIHIPKNASPGGHYGVIRFSGTAPNVKGSGVALSASLGALMLITVKGPITEKLSLQELSVAKLNKDNSLGQPAKLFESAPLGFIEKIKNEGNVHEQPAGNVIIKDMFGKPVAGVNINLPPRNILPDSTRRFTQPLDKSVIGNKRLFGHYTATMTLKYGKGQTLTAKTAFWVIPWKLILAII